MEQRRKDVWALKRMAREDERTRRDGHLLVTVTADLRSLWPTIRSWSFYHFVSVETFTMAIRMGARIVCHIANALWGRGDINELTWRRERHQHNRPTLSRSKRRLGNIQILVLKLISLCQPSYFTFSLVLANNGTRKHPRQLPTRTGRQPKEATEHDIAETQEICNETLRRNSHSSHEEPTAKTKVSSIRTSTPHPSPITRNFRLLVLQPIMTVSRSSTHTSPASRRAGPRRDAFEGYIGGNCEYDDECFRLSTGLLTCV